MRRLALLCLVAVAACGNLIGIEERPVGDPNEALFDQTTTRADSGAQPGTSDTPSSTTPPVVIEGGLRPEASIPVTPPEHDAGPIGCITQNVNWTVATTSCSASSGAPLASGESRTIADSSAALQGDNTDATGKITITCDNGILKLSDSKCELPQAIDVYTPTGCVNGYCMAAVGGKCGTPDPAKAKAICVFRGYADVIAYATAGGPVGANQCDADGTGCFGNQNFLCNIVFSSVTCTY